jgi:CheY-like chemotaxis protein
MQTLHTVGVSGETGSMPLASTPVLPRSASFDVAGHAATVLPPTGIVTAGDALQPILVAEDDEDDVFFIQRLIKKTGVKNPIKIFDDGSEVVNFLGGARLTSPGGRQRCPRLMFLDLNMRGLGGFEFLEWARKQEGLGPLTIVVLSNSMEPANVARAMELGAHRYLVKYPSVQTMSTIVHSVYPQTVF